MRCFVLTCFFAAGIILASRGARGEPVALVHARLIDGTGTPVRPDSTVVIDHGLIISVGKPALQGTKQIDLAGKTLMPALISDHSHVGLVSGISTASRNYTRAGILAELNQYARYGVLTVASLGLNKSPLFDELRIEQHHGLNPGADLFGVDQGIGAPGGMPPASMLKGMGEDQLFRPQTPEQARHAVDSMADEGTDLVKIWLDDLRLADPSNPPVPLLAQPVWQAAIGEAHKRHLRVAVHIHDLDLARQAVSHGADILAHGVRDKPVDAAFIAQMKRAGTWYVPTLALDDATTLFAAHPESLNDPFIRDAMPQALQDKVADPDWRRETLSSPVAKASQTALAINMRNVLTLYKSGVRIGFGTDSGATPLRLAGYAEHRELALLVQAGLTPLQALTLATGQAASLLMLKDRGLIVTGKRADLLVIDGAPDRTISDINRISQVWQHGSLLTGVRAGQGAIR